MCQFPSQTQRDHIPFPLASSISPSVSTLEKYMLPFLKSSLPLHIQFLREWETLIFNIAENVAKKVVILLTRRECVLFHHTTLSVCVCVVSKLQGSQMLFFVITAIKELIGFYLLKLFSLTFPIHREENNNVFIKHLTSLENAFQCVFYSDVVTTFKKSLSSTFRSPILMRRRWRGKVKENLLRKIQFTRHTECLIDGWSVEKTFVASRSGFFWKGVISPLFPLVLPQFYHQHNIFWCM